MHFQKLFSITFPGCGAEFDDLRVELVARDVLLWPQRSTVFSEKRTRCVASG